MGKIIRGRCSNCGYQAELFVGGGLRDCRPETALSAVPGNPSLERAVRSGARFEIERDIAVCRRCQKLLVMPYITYWSAEDEVHHATSACPECGGLPTRLGEELKSTPCPVCGRNMKLLPDGHWD